VVTVATVGAIAVGATVVVVTVEATAGSSVGATVEVTVADCFETTDKAEAEVCFEAAVMADVVVTVEAAVGVAVGAADREDVVAVAATVAVTVGPTVVRDTVGGTVFAAADEVTVGARVEAPAALMGDEKLEKVMLSACMPDDVVSDCWIKVLASSLWNAVGLVLISRAAFITAAPFDSDTSTT